MPTYLNLIVMGLIAGLAMPVGALIARFENIRPNWLEQEFRHTVIAFGGGALLSAVALILVPDGIEKVPPGLASLCLLVGGAAFMALDRWMAARKTSASQLVAMLSDFIPESIALGAMLALGGGGAAWLLVLLMALQNTPEGFNAYRELRASTNTTATKIILAFTAMALLGPLAALVGYFWLSDFQTLLACIMLFAAGGILYSVFGDIAPKAKLENHRAPPMGAVLGFTLGVVGHMLVQ
ncbi:divalent cation transporter [Simiduia sp. 21SJ11W-1]|uniref:ZIP family metal transporter n=1 Tax=Simiduia sp. 21SJ11W-1 TaxID=2909669 RepID=UPI0020A0555E|nr:divalent cation transporter [Simiduia sp. 21SJ11W-1]UTA47843.1 divalent cation transporter [Simiduia sp. 21SJ11W-1]